MREPVDWPTRDLLTHRVRATPEKAALIDAETNEEWTYRDLDRRVQDAATRLDSFSDSPERVAMLMDTRPDFATVVFAAMRLGITLVPLNVRETADVLRQKIERTTPDAVICERAREATALEIADCPVASVDEPDDESVYRLIPGGSTNVPPNHDGSDQPRVDERDDQSRADERNDQPRADERNRRSEDGEYGDERIQPRSLTRDDVLLVMFTSGTGGEPKAVRLTVGNLVASATASAFRLGVLPDDRWLCSLPMYHVGGLAPVLRSTLYGTAVVIQRGFDPGETARVAAEYEVTGTSLVPTTCSRLLDVGWTPHPELRFVLLGGAPASSELVDRCARAGIPLYPTYGTTETASQIATATPEEAFAHAGTVGHPLAFTDVTIVDDDGDAVGPNRRGEIVVSGPTVTPGYLEEERTADAWCEHGLRTGDVGYCDEDGRLWVHNRLDDRIVTGGENVDPGAVAEVVRSHPEVAEAAVVGLPDEEWGERVATLIVPEDVGDPPSPASVARHCESRLAGFKRPKTVVVAETLPRTASGTVDRSAVRTQLREDEAGEADSRR